MSQNTELRNYHHIINLLLQEGFDIFEAPVKGEGSDIIIRQILSDFSSQYIEIQILSRTEEFTNDLIIPIEKFHHNVFYYFILHSPGMKRMWLLRADELIKLRSEGLDARDTSPYLVKNFNRLKFPKLSLEEFKNQKII